MAPPFLAAKLTPADAHWAWTKACRWRDDGDEEDEDAGRRERKKRKIGNREFGTQLDDGVDGDDERDAVVTKRANIINEESGGG